MTSYCTLSTAFGVVTALYLALVAQQIYLLMNPLTGVEVKGPTVDPMWTQNQTYDILCYLSTSSQFKSINTQTLRRNHHIIFEQEQLLHTVDQEAMSIDLRILHPLSEMASNHTLANNSVVSTKKIFSQLQSNSSNVFLHVLARKHGSTSSSLRNDVVEVTAKDLQSGDYLYGAVRLIKYDYIPKHYRYRYLLSDFGLVNMTEAEETRMKMPRSTIISYWKPEVSVKLVADFAAYPHGFVPAAVMKNVPVFQSNGHQNKGPYFYKPSLFVDELGLTSDKYIPLNDSTASLPLTISIAPLSSQRWFLLAVLEDALTQQKGLGFTDKDLDDIRRMITDTSVYLLGVTILASTLHLLFEFLAFQSDIKFWQGNKSLAGLSTRTLFTDLLSQIIVFLFLLESEASLLVVVPSGAAILIQCWKVWKATGVSISLSSKTLLQVHFKRWEQIEHEISNDNKALTVEVKHASTDEVKPDVTAATVEALTEADSAKKITEQNAFSEEMEEKLARATLEADRFATHYIGSALIPLVLALVVRSLIYDRHKSWYSWFIGSLTSCVYTFGFVFMCPQLYINHQLKSVSHLPWNYLIYKFLNTFVDDLFAFVIKMPTMHRLSVFRDDLIFLIYLYQRWIYKVDKNRPTEK